MSIFIQLNKWIHGGINLLSDSDRNRGRSNPLKLLGMMEPSRCWSM